MCRAVRKIIWILSRQTRICSQIQEQYMCNLHNINFFGCFWMEPSPSIKLVTLWFKLLFDMQSTKWLTQALFSARFPRQPYTKCKQVGRQNSPAAEAASSPCSRENNNMKKYGDTIRWPGIKLLKGEICIFITSCNWFNISPLEFVSTIHRAVNIRHQR